MLNGTSKIREHVRIILEDTFLHFSTLFLEGFGAQYDWSDPVEWRPRHQNPEADLIVNHCMDHHVSYLGYTRQCQPHLIPEKNFLLWSDGGHRAGSEVGGWAWLIREATPPFHIWMYAGSSSHQHKFSDSLQAEAWGIKMALACFTALARGGSLVHFCAVHGLTRLPQDHNPMWSYMHA